MGQYEICGSALFGAMGKFEGVLSQISSAREEI